MPKDFCVDFNNTQQAEVVPVLQGDRMNPVSEGRGYYIFNEGIVECV